MCDCQHTTKKSPAQGHYEEEFDFACFSPTGAHSMAVRNLITMNASTTFANVSHPTAVYAQTIVQTMGMHVPSFLDSPFHTATIAFHDDGKSQYKWVLEFSCGGLEDVFAGGFVGINMYARERDSTSLQEMQAAARERGLGWVLDRDFHIVPHGKRCQYNHTQPSKEMAVATDAPSAPVAKLPRLLAGFPNPVCLVRHCLKEMIACEHGDPNCAQGLQCTEDCGKHNNTMACLYSCLNSYEDPAYAAFVRCSVTDHACVTPLAPADQIKSCQTPAPYEAFDPALLQGRWYIPLGLNPVIDCYPCQYGEFSRNGTTGEEKAFFEFRAPMQQGGSRVRTLNESYKALSPGRFQLATHADGLDQYQNFTVLAVVPADGKDHAHGSVMMGYWCATNNINNLNEGINVFTQGYQLPPAAAPLLKAAAAKHGFDFGNFCTVDNTNCTYAH